VILKGELMEKEFSVIKKKERKNETFKVYIDI
jgi:hypothetical protein